MSRDLNDFNPMHFGGARSVSTHEAGAQIAAIFEKGNASKAPGIKRGAKLHSDRRLRAERKARYLRNVEARRAANAAACVASKSGRA